MLHCVLKEAGQLSSRKSAWCDWAGLRCCCRRRGGRGAVRLQTCSLRAPAAIASSFATHAAKCGIEMQPETGALQGIWNFVSTFDAKKDPATRSTDRDCNSLNALVALLDTARADNRVLLRVASSAFMKTRLAKTFALTILREMVRGGGEAGGGRLGW